MPPYGKIKSQSVAIQPSLMQLIAVFDERLQARGNAEQRK
nr:MAG TPA: hypothetical protein [Caudoviricetes sp.]